MIPIYVSLYRTTCLDHTGYTIRSIEGAFCFEATHVVKSLDLIYRETHDVDS